VTDAREPVRVCRFFTATVVHIERGT